MQPCIQRHRRNLVPLVLLFVAQICTNSHAALKSEKIAGGFSKPVFVTQAPGDNDRLFVVEQHTGRIRIYKFSAGKTNTAPFLTVTGISTQWEQGLLGLAFDPGYQTNGYFYVNYNIPGTGGGGQTIIARFQAEGDPALADGALASSGTVLLSFAQPEINHNGGWIGFGKDGCLYIATGDGGGANDQHGTIGNGQSRMTLLGKMLRIDVHSPEGPYGIPDGNPFKDHPTYRPEIWAFGLRNPWRCSIDRETGDVWVGDVGQDAREEIDIIPSGTGGLNFGWRPREGLIATPQISEEPVTPAMEPVHEYVRTPGLCVTGGYRYRGSTVGELEGLYIFSDYTSSRFWTLRYDGSSNVVVTDVTSQVNPSLNRPIQNVSSFGEDNLGEIYICDFAAGNGSQGEIYRIASTEPPPMRIRDMTMTDDRREILFSFNARAGKIYEVEMRSSLFADGWATMSTMETPNSNMTLTVRAPMSQDSQYFRLKELP
jgi:glucose/arabinose dehydrogenase